MLWSAPIGCPQMGPRAGHGLQGPSIHQQKGEQWKSSRKQSSYKHCLGTLGGCWGPLGVIKLPPSSLRAVPWICREKKMSVFLVDTWSHMFGVEGA